MVQPDKANTNTKTNKGNFTQYKSVHVISLYYMYKICVDLFCSS